MNTKRTIDKAIRAIDADSSQAIAREAKAKIESAKWISDLDEKALEREFMPKLASVVGKLYAPSEYEKLIYRPYTKKYNEFVKRINREIDRLHKAGYKISGSNIHNMTITNGSKSIIGDYSDAGFFEKMKALK